MENKKENKTLPSVDGKNAQKSQGSQTKGVPYILQISARVGAGGASRIAIDVNRELQKYGFVSKIATGDEISEKSGYLKIHTKTLLDPQNLWESFFFLICRKTSRFIGRIKGAGRLTNLFYNIGRPSRLIKQLCGVENFENYPGTREFFKSLTPFPDIIHCHNLHGYFFDLRVLSDLSKKVPVVLTLHDEWMLTGHCAYSFDCTRWKIGCGKCPYLTTYQTLWRDSSRYNLKQKLRIYQNSQLHIITPSQWLMDEAKESVLAAGMASSHVIHNGVNLSLFKPADKEKVRKEINIPLDAHILLHAADRPKTNPFKDFQTLERAISLLEQYDLPKKLILLCVGQEGEVIQKKNSEIHFVKYLDQLNKLVKYYQAADLFVHVTKKDNFPTTIIEALACGLPIIGTKVGGIVEQIHDYKISLDQATGTFYTIYNHHELAQEIYFLLTNPSLRAVMSKNARIDAEKRFNIDNQIDKYVTVYKNLLKESYDPESYKVF